MHRLHRLKMLASRSAPAIGGLASSYVGMETAFVGVGCAFLGSAVANHYIFTEVAPPQGSKHSNPLALVSSAFSAWYSILRSSADVRTLVGSQAMLYSAVAGTNMTLMPLLLFAEPLNFTAASIGALAAATATLGVVVTQPLAVFADTYGRRTALGLGSVWMGTSLALVPFAGTPALVSGAIASTAVGQNLLAPSIGALLVDTVVAKDPRLVTQAMSLLRSATDIGMVSGAALVGAIGTNFGFAAGYEASSCIVLVMGVAAFLRLPPTSVKAKSS